MAFKTYLKEPKDISDQILLIQSKGVVVNDLQFAKQALLNIGFYRLSGYWSQYSVYKAKGRFKPNVKFEAIVDVYLFDCELRNLLFRNIDNVEICLRAKLSFWYAVGQMDAFWYKKPENFNIKFNLPEFLDMLDAEVLKSHEEFVKHHRRIYGYGQSQRMPSWKSLEILTLGSLCKLIGGLDGANTACKALVTDCGLPAIDYLHSCIHAIAITRNICAHHGRLWARRITIKPTLLRLKSHFWLIDQLPTNDSIYSVICCINYLNSALSLNIDFKVSLKNLVANYPNVDLALLGFTKDWDKDPFWV